jgi:hypothetical protein
MDNLGQLRTAIQSDITIGDESTLYPPATIDLAINRAYRKAGALFPWPELMDAKKTSTQTDQEYYDYPQTWRANSIWKLEVDGVRYGEDPDGSPLSFDDYLNWKEDYPNSTDKKWANQWKRYFFSPVPTTNGSNNISVWGIMNVETLSEDADVTIFSYSSPECNEAIVLEAVAILKSKGEQEKSGEFRSNEAKQILAVTWGKIAKEMGKYEKIQPFFDIPDYFGGNGTRDMTGKFNIKV